MLQRHWIPALLLAVIVLASGATTVTWAPSGLDSSPAAPGDPALEPGLTCSASQVAEPGAPDPERVPPGCCTSNCSKNRDCDRICGKGNCVCVAVSDCCSRCTY